MANMNWEKANKDQIVRERGGTYKNEQGYKKKKRKQQPFTIMNSKFKGYCSSCHFTIWQNEKIKYDGKARHMNCSKAIKDNTPRVLDSKYIKIAGKASKQKIKNLL